MVAEGRSFSMGKYIKSAKGVNYKVIYNNHYLPHRLAVSNIQVISDSIRILAFKDFGILYRAASSL
jgi:hypothetical protein